MSDPTTDTLPQIETRAAWRRNDPELERDVVGFWRRLGILPPDVVPEARAKELCSLTYVDGEVAAVSTATLEVLPHLRARFAMVRIAVAPEHRRRHFAVSLIVAAKGLLEQWSLENPQENVKGVAAFIQAANIEELKRLPVWPRSGLSLVGYTTDGQQIRVAWFEHARLDL
jgi:hypothetical protein